jgi:predicted TIM-barrel fold metal-dependent hydrolase
MSVSVTTPTAQGSEQVVPVQIVDCDVHPALKSQGELTQYLPEKWHYLQQYSTIYPYRIDLTHHGSRSDSRPDGGGPAGSDPELFGRQLFDEAGVDLAIIAYHSLGALPHPEADAARNAAINEWQAATWLGEYNDHERYRGSIRISASNPDAAVREIERWADHPYFVQVLAVAGYSPPFGQPSYEPIWRAAAEHGLPVAVHASNDALNAVQYWHPFGPPTYAFEWHASSYPLKYAAHAASLICSGVFERLPDLRFVLVEGGISWALALGGHLDRNWRFMRDEVPHLSMAPSEYLRRNVYFSTQPIEEPNDPAALLQVFELLGEEHILFSTDYPHWDFDDPKRALPRMPAELRSKILAGNACALYGLPTERKVDVQP